MIKKIIKKYKYIDIFLSVLILLILILLSYPRFKIFLAEARQSEAKRNLSLIYNLEKKYFNKHGKYIKIDKSILNNCNKTNNLLGFIQSNCEKSRYEYEILKADKNELIVIAKSVMDKEYSVFPKCKYQDIWQIDHTRKFKNNGALIKCIVG